MNEPLQNGWPVAVEGLTGDNIHPDRMVVRLMPEGSKVPTRLSLSIADLHELAEMVRQFERPLAELWEKRRVQS